MDSVVQSITFEDIVMKIKEIINPLGVTLKDFKDPAFQTGLVGGFFWVAVAFAVGYGVGELLK